MRQATGLAQGARRGQSAAEYAIVFSVVIAALVGMQIYVKRGLNAKLKDGSDGASNAIAKRLTGAVATNEARQYEPYYADSQYTVTQDANRADNVASNGAVSRNVTQDKTQRTGSQTVSGVDALNTGGTPGPSPNP